MSNISRRGFASMLDKERQREIASMGGKAAHDKGVAHEFTPAEARRAGRLGAAKRTANLISRRRDAAGTIPPAEPEHE